MKNNELYEIYAHRQANKTFTSIPAGYRIREVGEPTNANTDLYWENGQWIPFRGNDFVKYCWIIGPICESKPEWMPMTEKPPVSIIDNPSYFTIVKVVGWNRVGFACYQEEEGWTLKPDPCAHQHYDEKNIISWLKI
jgi:hypothetical protein